MNFSYKNIDTAHSEIKDQIIQTPLISNDYLTQPERWTIFKEKTYKGLAQRNLRENQTNKKNKKKK